MHLYITSVRFLSNTIPSSSFTLSRTYAICLTLQRKMQIVLSLSPWHSFIHPPAPELPHTFRIGRKNLATNKANLYSLIYLQFTAIARLQIKQKNNTFETRQLFALEILHGTHTYNSYPSAWDTWTKKRTDMLRKVNHKNAFSFHWEKTKEFFSLLFQQRF